MHILHIFNGEDTGGAKVHLFSLLKQLNTKEIILGIIGNSNIEKEVNELGVKVVYFKQESRYNLSLLSQISNYIKENNIDIVHTHGARANLYGYLLKKIVKFQWLTTVHSDPRDDFLGRGIFGKIFTSLHLFVLRRVDHLFAISERFKDMLLSFGINAQKITVIYNGIDFSNIGERKLTRDELHLTTSDFVIAMIARLDAVKAHSNVINAISIIKNKTAIPVKLLLVGEGSLRPDLQQQVQTLQLSNNVLFLGHRADVDDILNIADVKLLASFSESFPLVILESARANTAVISTDVGGVTELISNQSLGWVIDNNSPERIADAICKAIEAKQQGTLKQIGENLQIKAAKHYDIHQFANSVYSTYEKVYENRIQNS